MVKLPVHPVYVYLVHVSLHLVHGELHPVRYLRLCSMIGMDSSIFAPYLINSYFQWTFYFLFRLLLACILSFIELYYM